MCKYKEYDSPVLMTPDLLHEGDVIVDDHGHKKVFLSLEESSKENVYIVRFNSIGGTYSICDYIFKEDMNKPYVVIGAI